MGIREVFRSFIVLILSLSAFSTATAHVDYQKTKPLVFPVLPEEVKPSSQSVAEFIPMEMSPSQDQTYVFSNIADRSIQYFWRKSSFQYTSVGRMAHTLEKKLKADVTMHSQGPNPIEHKITFQLLATQAIARLEYTGWIKAAFKYYAKEAKSETQVSERVFTNKDLILSHSSTAQEDVSSLLLRWNW